MCTITERSICTNLAVAHFVVSAIVHIKHNGSITSDCAVTHSITPGTILGDTA